VRRVVDKHVDRAEGLFGAIEQHRHAGRVGQIGLDRLDPATGRANLADDRLGGQLLRGALERLSGSIDHTRRLRRLQREIDPLAQVSDEDGRALRREGSRRRRTNAVGRVRAGDQGNFAIQAGVDHCECSFIFRIT